MTVVVVMTVGYYRLPDWAYRENGLEHQNTAPELRAELRARLPLSFVRQRSRKAPRRRRRACNSIRASTTACRGVQRALRIIR